MTRTLTITAAEWASRTDATLWLVRPGVRQYVGLKPMPASPPAEFVQACAPCETCGQTRFVVADDGRGGLCDIPCPDCRIELVGPSGATLGYGYAVGEALPTRSWAGFIDPPEGVWLGCSEATVAKQECHNDLLVVHPAITADLAHYGPPESLVGKWALRVDVQVVA